jgi:hypothetical protein
MCEFLSGFIHNDAAILKFESRYLFGDLHSHSGTMKLHKLKYGHPDVWREFEWTGEEEGSLVVRSADEATSAKLKKVMLRDFKNRTELLENVKFPDSLTTLYFSYATVPAGLKFPDSLTTLDLRCATVPAGLKFPAKCRIIR